MSSSERQESNASFAGTASLRSRLLPLSDLKMPSYLKPALKHLGLQGYDDLEKRFLSTNAFLIPWASFRESIFLIQPDKVPRLSSASDIKRTDLLRFYTQYEQGYKRYDPRADDWTLEYTGDKSKYGFIDKSEWDLQKHELLLYAWLLQDFKVGKTRNELGFDYFKCRNVCTAWEQVLLPIVRAVSESYSSRGRHHDGRLAKFVESQLSSRGAYTDEQVSQDSSKSPSSSRIIPGPKPYNKQGSTLPDNGRQSFTAKMYDDAEKELRDVYPHFGHLVERPRFKQDTATWLAEMKASKIKARNALEQVEAEKPQGLEEPQDKQLQSPLKNLGSDTSLTPTTPKVSTLRRSLSGMVRSPSLPSTPGSGSISATAHGLHRRPSEADDNRPKLNLLPRPPFLQSKPPTPTYGPDHGVTRQVSIPEDKPRRRHLPRANLEPEFRRSTDDNLDPTLFLQGSETTKLQHRRKRSSLRQSITLNPAITLDPEKTAVSSPSSFRLPSCRLPKRSTPVKEERRIKLLYSNDLRTGNCRHPLTRGISPAVTSTSQDSVFSPMGPPSAIPKPLLLPPRGYGPERISDERLEEVRKIVEKKIAADPSILRGRDFQKPKEEPASSSSAGDTNRAKAQRHEPDSYFTNPYGINPFEAPWNRYRNPFVDAATVAASYRKEEEWPPRAIPWPGFGPDDSDDEPEPKPKPKHKAIVIPAHAKSFPDTPDQPVPIVQKPKPTRSYGMPSKQPARRDSDEALGRIVSLENIRSALSNVSDGEEEEEQKEQESVDPWGRPLQGTGRANPRLKQPLKTYNKHMFPRKEVREHPTVKQRLEEDPTRYERGGSYEMEVLRGEGKEE